ncbi:MAG: BamA/TamA family outer membrane protein [candidate division Zixibacteria bacterium]|nr:BamA/TamA family outer membrane protein [candidate division Zixibacteria bacterium]
MRKKMLVTFSLILAISILLSITVSAVETKYKDYKKKNLSEELFRITIHKEQVHVSLMEKGEAFSISFGLGEIEYKDSVVLADDRVVFDEIGLVMNGICRNYEDILDMTILDNDDTVTITFLTRQNSSRRVARLKRGNRITFSGPIVVEEDEFVRGIVFSVTGDLEVYGEVNKDVVTLFGDVYVGPAAVVRGDIASLSGHIDIARDASIYGEIYSDDEQYKTRRKRFLERREEFNLEGSADYNRVDGLYLEPGLRFDDPDSVLPSTWVRGGYAFESERWRFRLGLEQPILRRPGLAIGGEYYRELSSEDDWLLDDNENLVFVALVTEDFKDYYESEGGRAYLNFEPHSMVDFTFGYKHEETKWLYAHRHIWSLFGGSKIFRKNFSTIEDTLQDTMIAAIDSGTNSCLTAAFDFNTCNPEDRFVKSSWHISGFAEWSSPDFASDYNYRRYQMAVRRYQHVSHRTMFLLRGIYGGSDGDLPIHKRFFLGGLGTLRGYHHKEYTGTRFWMANTEYRIRFPRTDIAASLFWDIGQTDRAIDDTTLDEVKNSIGIALHFGDDLRINLSKRLDRSFDNNPKVYVRLEHVF